jgi:hypothetical protein
MDPERLINESTDFERELLRAGRSDAMSAESRRVILGALGVGGSLVAAGTIAAGVKASSGKGLLTALGITGAGAIGAVGVWAGLTLTEPAQVPIPKLQPSPEPRALVIETKPAPVTPPVEVVTPDSREPPSKDAPAPRAPSTVSDPLSLELSAIESARSALARRDYARALRLLDEHRKRFPKARLMAEATVLRIEALAASGEKQAAARIGKAFLARDPNGPYARRVRSLLGEIDPSHGGQ